MEDTFPASVGLVLAGVAFAAAFLPWPGEPTALPAIGEIASPIAALVAGLALVAFGLRRHGLLARRPGAILAGGTSLLVVGYALLAFFGPIVAGLPTPDAGLGLVLSLSAGLGAVGMAFSDDAGTGRDPLVSKGISTLKGLLVGGFGLLFGSLVGALAVLGLGLQDPNAVMVVSNVLAYAGILLVAVGYLFATDRGFDYLDFEVPTLRDVGVMVLGVVAIFGLLILVNVVTQAIGLPTTDNSIVEPARQGNVETLLVLIPLSWLIIGPSEEILYRNVIQKELYTPFSRWGAVVVASAIFAVVHVPAYYDPNLIATLTMVVVVFFLSLLLGAAYLYTDNITVPAVIHGTFNALQFAALYVTLSGDMPTQTAVWVPEVAFLLVP